MVRLAATMVAMSVLGACSGVPPAGVNVHPSLHPTLEDALAQGFQVVAGRAPYTARLWVDDADGLAVRWDTHGDGVTDAWGARPAPVRFARPGVYRPSVTLQAPGRSAVTLSTRIVVLGDAPAPLPPGRYGVNEDLAWDPPQQIAAEIALMKAAQVEWLRLPLRWNWLEPQRGQDRWDRTDTVVRQADDAELRLLAVLGGTPRWSSGLDGGALPRGLRPDSFEPSDARDFAAYVYRVVDRYRGRVDAYEMLNEPNSPEHWAPRPNAARFVELLCAGYLAAKYADPGVPVVVGGLNGNGLSLGWEVPEARDFLKAIYAGPGARCFDVMAIHPFAHPTEDGLAVLQRWIDQARGYMDQQGDRRELWVTETGWSSGNTLWGHATISEDEQAEWLRDVYGKVTGPQKLFWYNFKETRANPSDPEAQWGWLRYDLEPKPAYGAFAALRK